MRVTLDLDHVLPLTLRRKLRLEIMLANLRYLLEPESVEVRVSSGGAGLHIIAYGVDTDLEGSVDLRALLGDDRARIAYDLERITGWFHSTLWTEKNGGKARSVPVSALEDALHSGARVL